MSGKNRTQGNLYSFFSKKSKSDSKSVSTLRIFKLPHYNLISFNTFQLLKYSRYLLGKYLLSIKNKNYT